jgi:hypothetical protein
MLNDALSNLQIDLFEGPEGFINFALSAEFDGLESKHRRWELDAYT